MASGEWGKGSWLDSSNKTPPLPTTRATIVRFGLTRRLGFVGDDATDEVRLSAAQGRHQVIQLFLFRFQVPDPIYCQSKTPRKKCLFFQPPKVSGIGEVRKQKMGTDRDGGEKRKKMERRKHDN